jgi:putative colanic acid biosynthesis acetyltransferase WcaF
MGERSTLASDVDCYSVAPIVLGPHSTVSQNAHLCAAAHDDSDPGFRLLSKPITIGARAWVAARAFVGPGVTVREGAVIGARAVVSKDVPEWTIMAGNPAVQIRKRSLNPL